MIPTATATVLRDEMLRTIALEFQAMPGMRLTMSQVRRLWSLDERQGERAIEALVTRGVLARDPDGCVCRALARAS